MAAGKWDLDVTNLGPVAAARMRFGDLTVIVGPQATGKSLLLQLWKLRTDRAFLLPYLREQGIVTPTPEDLLDVYFGDGMRTVWGPDTRVAVEGKPVTREALLSHRGLPPSRDERVFYAPAHRAILLGSAGWPLRFHQLPQVPVVARLFSDHLHQQLLYAADVQFPHDRRFKGELRARMADAAFRGGQVQLEARGTQQQLRLHHSGDVSLGYMTWTAGQRELVPLLLALQRFAYEQRIVVKTDRFDTIIVEEPEMGLHPAATVAMFTLLLELVHRGYKVIVSTHAPVVLDVMWGLEMIAQHGGDATAACAMLGLESTPTTRDVLKSALAATRRVYAMQPDADGRATAVDISTLDPASDDATVSGWGGLTGLSSRVAEQVGRVIATTGT